MQRQRRRSSTGIINWATIASRFAGGSRPSFARPRRKRSEPITRQECKLPGLGFTLGNISDRRDTMSQLFMYELPLSRFHWNKATKELSAEASDLDGFRIQQIWDDACDEGICIRSERTGRVERFYLTKIDFHMGEIAGWFFKPVSEAL